MASKLAICKLALVRLGHPPILSLDQKGKAPESLKAVYDLVRDIVLADHDWNFASRRATLAQLTEAPAFGYAYAYQLPVGCLRVWGMVGLEEEVDPTLVYKIEGNQLLTNESSAKVKYTVRVTDETLFPARFISAFATRLAMEVGFYITVNPQIRKILEDSYEKSELPGARSIDAQEGTPTVYVSNPWLDSRR